MLDGKTGRELVEMGCFACTYSDVWDAMAEWYSNKWDAKRYISPRATGSWWENIDGVDYYLRMRGNMPLLWLAYTGKVATALEKIRETL